MSMEEKKWTLDKIQRIYQQPFNDLLYQAQTIHRQHHDPNALEFAMLLNIKTGACPEDCGYCSQSGHVKTHVQKEKLMSVDAVLKKAMQAKESGAKRFCIGAAWRCPPDSALPHLKQMIQGVKALGLESCMTLGLLNEQQANYLKDAGLDFYNHNIDTSPAYYEKVVTTRKFSDRLATLEQVNKAGIKVCCGGILGIGETQHDRLEFLLSLVSLNPPPTSIPINRLIPVEGTPLAQSKPIDSFELVRTIATARIIMPKSIVRLTAGRTAMSDELQALCFYAGANSVFIGDKLLTEGNPTHAKDKELFHKLGLTELTE